MTDAIAQPRIDLAATPAWNGWTRPGRATEVDIRLSADTATRATLDVVAGSQIVRASVDLEPGRIVRLQVPIESAEEVAVSAASPAAPPQRREIRIAHSESPLLGVGLVIGDPVHLEGFHMVALDADDLPRNASAYSSIDALILDAPTLGALDERQLGALLVHAAECGRIVLLNVDPRVRRVLDGAGGCGGRSLMNAASLADAKEMLNSSLAASMVPATALPEFTEFARPDHLTWNRVLIVLAAYFAAATLAAIFFSSLPVMLLVPALATVAILALLHFIQPSPQLVVWSEAASGAQMARYQAWQRFPGVTRGRTRVPVLPQLASARSCDPTQAMLFDFDASRGRATFAEFDTRLFRQVSLCYSGSFPVARAIAIDARPDGLLHVRNTGSIGWPKGALLAGGLVHELPALGPGDDTIIPTRSGKSFRDNVLRTAMARARTDGTAALWELELGGVADIPLQSKGWLLVSIPPP
ncbi:MAG: hypothetical protein ABI886_11155 [Betaproteobacteria bacterium]